MIHNGIELQTMTHNGVEVQSWIHNGVEVFGGKVQLRYEFHTYSDTSGNILCNIKKYDANKNELILDTTLDLINNTSSYADDCVKVEYASLTAYRYTITLLVAGEFKTLSGGFNNGIDYNGTSNQWVPYQTTTSQFVTTGGYKP